MGAGCSEHHPFGFQGDQRDEEEETQMKKSESEVEVSTVGGTRHLSLAWVPQSGPAWPDCPCAPRRQQPLLPSDLIIHGSSLSSRKESLRPPQAAAMCPHPSTTDQVVPAPTPLPNPHSSGFGLEPLWDLPCPRIKPTSPVSPAFQANYFTAEIPGKPSGIITSKYKKMEILFL